MAGAKETALVILYYIYPKRMSRKALTAALAGTHSRKPAVQRIVGFLDDNGMGMIRLRNTRRRKVEELFAEAIQESG
jgi:hypothetical protein